MDDFYYQNFCIDDHHQYDDQYTFGGYYEQENLVFNHFDVDEASLFHDPDFPPLPENFPCMSSSSSSSPIHAPFQPITISPSTSSAASMVEFKPEAVESGGLDQNDTPMLDVTTGTLSSTTSMEVSQQQGNDQSMDFINDFEYMDLIDTTNGFFEPNSILDTNDNNFPLEEVQEANDSLPAMEVNGYQQEVMNQAPTEEPQQQDGLSETDELAMLFLEWLKNNKDIVTAEDLRRVRIKRATVDAATRRLGGGREGRKQVLKLVLDWIQSNHSHKRTNSLNQNQNQNQIPNPNPSHLDPSNTCFTQWVPTPQYVNGAYNPQLSWFTGPDPFVNGGGCPTMFQAAPVQHYSPMMDSTQSWMQPQIGFPPQYTTPFCPGGYGDVQGVYQYPLGPGDYGLVRLSSSVTKEARRKRMVRQSRKPSHHRNQIHSQQNNQKTKSDKRTMVDGATTNDQANSTVNWGYWCPQTTAPPFMPVEPLVQPQSFQRHAAPDTRPSWNPEKNLRFLLQKVLKQSDVGTLGRIVLPKKEAETHLPSLDPINGISIPMEDIGISRVWNLRYRYWPNNKSRMYLLENTGDFVRANGLEEGDFFVIYSDTKSGKYLIRGVKVKHKLEKAIKAQRKSSSKGNNDSSSKDPTED